jgi:ketosteroid isomerase-like protein
MSSAEIASVIDRYVDAWRRSDADGVMALFASDAVLMPHDGLEPRVGHEAIRGFWFSPARAASGIDEFRFDLQGTTEHPRHALTWGKRVLQYWQGTGADKVTYRWTGTVLIALQRRDASWEITHFMWDDPPPERVTS